MTDIELPALHGRNPLGLFAALGALDVSVRALRDRTPTLRWTDEVDPTAVVTGPDSLEHLIELCDEDRRGWATSTILTWGLNGNPLPDLKPSSTELRVWLEALQHDYMASGDRRDLDLMGALLAEGATAAAGASDTSKPTHFHFTAGQQRFLVMVRELQAAVDADRLHEALVGPWRYDSPLPVLGWDARGERIYALRGFDPAKDKKLGVPGADWLGFLGLRYFPVSVWTGPGGRPQLVTTGCSARWKRGDFTWPLWFVPLSSEVASSVITDGGLSGLNASDRRRLGVHHLLRCPIRRTDQGGYGSFGPAGPAIGRAGPQSRSA